MGNYVSLLPISIFNIMLRLFLIIGLSTSLVAAIPRPQEDDYEEEEVCLTAKDSLDPEKECVFPFTHNNITYNGCPTDPDDETKRWCSTKQMKMVFMLKNLGDTAPKAANQ